MDDKKVKINYSIISRGTEKYGNNGYMGITENILGEKYIINSNHGVLYSYINDNALKFKDKYNINNIVVSRFELIVSICLNKYKPDDNIIIFGLGSLGFSCLIYLLKKGYKHITVFSKNKKNLKIIESKFNCKIKIVNDLNEDYNTYIDCTGSSEVLKLIFENLTYNKKIYIISTPRDSKYLIDPLMINRKNISIFGGHEFNGIDVQKRNLLYSKILKENEEYSLLFSNYINYHKFTNKKYTELLDKKSNYYDVFTY